MHQLSFEAFGTTAVVAVTDAPSLPGARAAVKEVTDAVDRACSRFRLDSELSAINAAGGCPVRVSSLMLDALLAALRSAEITDGDVDPTVGQALVALGYDRDFAELTAAPRPVRRPIPLAAVRGWQTVKVDPATSMVALPRGVTLDLGATAKALAADLAAAAAFESTATGVLVSFGGDLAIAGEGPPDGWSVRVSDDHRAGPDAPGQTITLQSGGLATSSTTVRRWQGPTGQVHHLLDPSTARPANGPWRTVTVAAGSCLDANTASTAAVIRGERAIEWLESLGLPSRLVALDGTVRHLAGWPRAGDELMAAAVSHPRPIRAPR